MDSYLEQIRKERILKIDLELDKAPPNYKNLISNLIKSNCKYKGYELLDILLSKKYRIKKYQICEDEDKFYNTIKLYKKFFYRVFQFEITKSDDVFGEIERSNFYNNIMEIYSKYGKKNFDFNTKDYLYIMFIYNIINKQFKIIIYNGLSESDFVYLVNNVDKLIETII